MPSMNSKEQLPQTKDNFKQIICLLESSTLKEVEIAVYNL